jgi:hypothetical protein
MEIYLYNTSQGLIPLYDEDYDQKKRLKIGQKYRARITVPRDLTKHRKYFALINCAWAFQNEKVQAFFNNNVDVFRKTVEMTAGHCEKVYSIKLKEWIDVPKSISFDSVDNIEFEEIYKRVYDVLLSTFLKHITEQEFMDNLINF